VVAAINATTSTSSEPHEKAALNSPVLGIILLPDGRYWGIIERREARCGSQGNETSKKGIFMERKEVSEEELLMLLNAELSKHNEMNQVVFTSIERLAEPDGAGCNWAKAHVKSSRVPHYVAAPVTGQIVAEARKKYNLK
jgi:hypothetical protein